MEAREATATTWILARHGKTQWNGIGRRQGQLDSAVTAEGLATVRAAIPVVASFPVERVFSSPLGRATTTARLLAEGLGLGVQVVESLREVDHGSMAGLTGDQIERRFPGELDRRAADRYRWRFPGGESYADADVRARSAVAFIDGAGARTVLVVSHEMIGRLLRRHLLGLSHEDALALDHPHEVLYRIDTAARREQAIPVGGLGRPATR